ncbi:segregation and condensation protein A [Roseomonas sp. BN140053]|uniref:segregation and condensation protein A n=1 Tax=Roseomonas sp. BN140053 TaxID=3391898 RepID=UPI0039ED76CB
MAGFEGPLDFLLEMVRRHRVDLGRVSIVTLTGQLVAAIESDAERIAIERRSDWLVLAAELVRLKAQLLAPPTPEVAAAADAEASQRLAQLEQVAGTRAAAAWLLDRPQLDQAVFGRGQAEQRPRPQAELLLGFLEATLALLEGRDGPRAPEVAPYRPSPLELWRVSDAIQRLRHLLGEVGAAGEGGPAWELARFLPELPADTPDAPLKGRAALASTLLAGLELARGGTLRMEQDQPFGVILLAAAQPTPVSLEDAVR